MARLFDLFRLQLYRLVVDEDALALVWLRLPPFPDRNCRFPLARYLPAGAFASLQKAILSTHSNRFYGFSRV